MLVVDDEPDARDLIRRVLAGSRARVLAAGSVPEALGLIAGHALHVLVSDIGLPDADGYDLIREVRARGLLGQGPARRRPDGLRPRRGPPPRDARRFPGPCRQAGRS